MGTERPVHLADLVDAVALDWKAADDDDAAAMLDLVEDLLERRVERGMPRVLGADLAQVQSGLLDPRQHILESRDLARREVDRNPLLGELATTPRHRPS